MRKMIMIAAVSAALGGGVTQAFAEPQPHMRVALASLREAREQLQKASADKGGHRVKAIGLINAAIDEVEAGMRFDNKH